MFALFNLKSYKKKTSCIFIVIETQEVFFLILFYCVMALFSIIYTTSNYIIFINHRIYKLNIL